MNKVNYFNTGIFKAYDIRGIYKKDFDEKDVYLIANLFGLFVLKETRKRSVLIAVNRDFRKSSPFLYQEALKGLKDSGATIIAAGPSLTPMHYFIINHTKADGGIMVTASHLAAKYNGFKLSLKGARPVAGTEFYKFFRKNINKIRKKIKGKVVKENFFNQYLNFLGINKITYNELTHSRNIIFDQDGDRVFFKDKFGKIVRPDFVAALLVQDFLKKHKKAKIIIDSRSSKILAETIKNYGGKVIFSRVGHAFFKKVMAKNSALFGAELSGHYYFKEFFNCDNGLLAAIKILNIVKKSGKKLDDLIKPFQKYYQSGEISIKIPNSKFLISNLRNHFKEAKKISYFDGLSVEYKSWWFNLRESNTESVIRLNIEAKTPEILKEKKFLLLKLLRNLR